MIICNATPLIAFARIGQLALLRKVVGTIIIPNAVAREISDYSDIQLGVIDLAHSSFFSTNSTEL